MLVHFQAYCQGRQQLPANPHVVRVGTLLVVASLLCGAMACAGPNARAEDQDAGVGAVDTDLTHGTAADQLDPDASDTASLQEEVGIQQDQADAGELDEGGDGATATGPWPTPEPAACSPAPAAAASPCDPAHDATSTAALCADGWCWRDPLPHGQGYGQPWGSSAKSIWFPGLYGKVFHFDGQSMQPVSIGSRHAVAEFTGAGPCNVWARLDHGTSLLHWQGKGWQEVAMPPHIGNLQLHMTAAGQLLLLRSDASIWQRKGETWIKPTITAAPLASSQAFWASSPTDIWVLGAPGLGNTAKAVVHWNGKQWTLLPALPIQEVSLIWGSGIADVWLVGSGPGGTHALHWTGATWAVNQLPKTTNARKIQGNCSGDVWLTFMDSLHHFDGANWKEAGKWSSGSVACAPLFADGVAAAAVGGGAQATLHLGSPPNWTMNHGCAPYGLRNSAAGAVGESIYLGHSGGVRHGNGSAWKSATLPTTWVRALVPWSATDALAIAETPEGWSAFRYNSGGWVALPAPPLPDLPDPTFPGATAHNFEVTGAISMGSGKALVVGGKVVQGDQPLPYPATSFAWHTVVHRFEDGQWTYEQVPCPKSTSIWASGPEDIWLVGNHKVWRRNAKNWQELDVASVIDKPWAVRGKGPNDVWLAGSSSLVAGAEYSKVLAHWDGSAWTTVKADVGMTAVTAQSIAFAGKDILIAGDGWVDGGIVFTCRRFGNGKWTEGGCPVKGELVQAGSEGKIWLVGAHELLEYMGN